MRSILSLTVPAETYDLTILATAKAELEIDDDDTTYDEVLNTYIHQVSNAIMTYTGRVFASETIRETFLAAEGAQDYIQLTRFPVSEITSITEDDDDALGASYYLADSNIGVLFRLDGSGYKSRWCFNKKLAVIYTAGYELLDELPYDIERAALVWIKDALFQRNRDGRIRSESNAGVADFAYFNPAAMPAEVLGLLQPYRQQVVG